MLTYLLIAINVAISLIGFASMNRSPAMFLFTPYEVSHGKNYVGVVLSHFSHADGAHLIFNMMTLYYFGPVVEFTLGPGILLLIYAAAGVASTVFVYYRHRSDPRYRALGASDSISGVLFAAIVLVPLMDIAFIFLPIPIPAPLFAIGYIALSMYWMKRGEGHVSHEAHLAGAAVGLVLSGLLSPDGFRPLLGRLQDLVS